jgi:hypothetical protein
VALALALAVAAGGHAGQCRRRASRLHSNAASGSGSDSRLAGCRRASASESESESEGTCHCRRSGSLSASAVRTGTQAKLSSLSAPGRRPARHRRRRRGAAAGRRRGRCVGDSESDPNSQRSLAPAVHTDSDSESRRLEPWGLLQLVGAASASGFDTSWPTSSIQVSKGRPRAEAPGTGARALAPGGRWSVATVTVRDTVTVSLSDAPPAGALGTCPASAAAASAAAASG